MNTQYDSYIKSADWLTERDQPVALTLIETLEPADGPQSVIFPPTYAVKGKNPYAISSFREDITPEKASLDNLEANICDLDSVGSQANRMEPAFAKNPLNQLVPQIVIKAKEGLTINLLLVGHRIADGAVRFSELNGKITEAIKALALNHDAVDLAKLTPTSLVFGFWNSREKEDPRLAIKFPRIVSSAIRATNVATLKRSAQFNPAFDPTQIGLADNMAQVSDQESNDKEEKSPLSQLGLRSAPAVDTHGGVRVFGQIVRRTEINLVALRALASVNEKGIQEDETLKLRRYLLGLSLIAARVQNNYNLRQGCLLVGKQDKSAFSQVVFPSGKRETFAWDVKTVYDFAVDAAKDFGTFQQAPQVTSYSFESNRVADALNAKSKEKAEKKAKKTAKTTVL